VTSEEPTAVYPNEHAEHHEIHLPPPSYWPVVMAIGLSAGLAGIVINPFVWIAGAVIVVVALSGWLRELARDIMEAPSEPEL
jgi:cytochrome c oxidase subunit I